MLSANGGLIALSLIASTSLGTAYAKTISMAFVVDFFGGCDRLWHAQSGLV
jgi:hypothetical protein